MLIDKDIRVGDHVVKLAMPDPVEVRKNYELKISNQKTDFPYWTKLWPSAIALASFIDKNIHFVKDKRVLEIGAGLGLPSIVASYYAAAVVCTDYLPEVVYAIESNITKNQRHNMTPALFDWRDGLFEFNFDVLLASDINYDTAEFSTVFSLFDKVLSQHKCILFSTPDRLQSRKFITDLQNRFEQHLELVHREETEGVHSLVFLISTYA